MSKAYDTVEWDFLRQVLLKFGFSQTWVNLVMNCMEIVHLNLCIAREKIASISPGRGLNHGDPLSPYLFILSLEALSCVINKALFQGQLVGLKLSTSCSTLTHSIFADDALFFMNADIHNCQIRARISLQKKSIFATEKFRSKFRSKMDLLRKKQDFP